MGAIYIESKPVGLGFDHLYLVYEDNSSLEWVIRGGPEGNLPPFGNIVVEVGVAISNSEDFRGEDTPQERGQSLVVSGAEADAIWTIMLQQAQNIHDAQIDYDALTQNSNSTVSSVLRAVGLSISTNYPTNTTPGELPAVFNFLDIATELVGTSSDDNLSGYSQADILDSGEGADTLWGYGGPDLLIGGRGSDIYFVQGGESVVDIAEKGKEGVIHFGAVGTLRGGDAIPDLPNAWFDASKNVTYTKSGSDLIASFDSKSITVSNYFLQKNINEVSGTLSYLGITLQGIAPPGAGPHAPDMQPSEARNGKSPIVIDFDGDGISTLALSTSIFFDLDNDGFKESTSWLDGSDGLLALDVNGNGLIDSGAELFGNNFDFNSVSDFDNGFDALNYFDGDADGLITNADAVYDELIVWFDRNNDGVSQSYELSSLSSLAISSIDLAYTNNDLVFDVNGNQYKQFSSVTLNDGSKVDAIDVWFNTYDLIREQEYSQAIDADILALPNITAFGKMDDLQIAMQTNAALKSMYLDLLQDPPSFSTYKTAITNFIYEWAGVSEFSADYFADVQVNWHGSDSREQLVLEVIAGHSFSGAGAVAPISEESAHIIKAEFEELYEYVAYSVLSETQLPDIQSVVNFIYDDAQERYILDATSLETYLLNLYSTGGYETLNFAMLALKGLDNSGYSVSIDVDGFVEGSAVLNKILIDNPIFFGEGFGTVVIDLDLSHDNHPLIILGGVDVSDLQFETDASKGIRITLLDGSGSTTSDSITIPYLISPNISDLITPQAIYIVPPGAGELPVLLDDWLPLVTVPASMNDDIIYGTPLDDYIHTLDGSDVVWDGYGNDTIVIDGLGDKIIRSTGAGDDTVIIENANSLNDIVVQRSSGDVRIDVYDSAGSTLLNSITFGGAFDSNTKAQSVEAWIEYIEIASVQYAVTSLDYDIAAATTGDDTLFGFWGDDTISGLDGNDSLYGSQGNDVLVGGLGDDKLYGGLGSDVFEWSPGEGNDTIYAAIDESGETDIVKLNGVSPSDVNFVGGPSAYQVQYLPTGESLWIRTYNNIPSSEVGMEEFHFGDGTVYTFTDVLEILGDASEFEDVITGDDGANSLSGLGGNDSINGLGGDDEIFGDDGSDSLFGGWGDDQLVGGLGDDALYGQGDNDYLVGGAGDDTLVGGTGGAQENNTFFFDGQFGNDTVSGLSDVDYQGGDTFLFGDMILPENVAISISYKYNETVTYFIDVDGYGTIRVNGYTGGDQRVGMMQFADGTVWDTNTIDGMVNTPTENNDIIFYDLGHDGTVSVSAGAGNDTLTTWDVGDDVNLPQFTFLDGGAGNDTITGSSGDDQIDGGEGNDTIYSTQGGNDFIVFGEGSGSDVMHLFGSTVWFKPDTSLGRLDFSWSSNGSDMIVNYIDSDDQFTLKNFNSSNIYNSIDLEFQSGIVTGYEIIDIANTITEGDDIVNLVAPIPGAVIDLLAGNDKIFIGSTNAGLTIYGGDGDDTIRANSLSTVYGGDGDDLLYYGARLIGGSGFNRYFGSADSTTYVIDINISDSYVTEWIAPASDTLELINVSLEELDYHYQSNHLVIDLVGSDNEIIFLNDLYKDNLRTINLSGGDSYTKEEFLGLLDTINHTPYVASNLADAVWSEDMPSQLLISSSTFDDVDGETLTLSATLADGSALPSWLTFEETGPEAGRLVGTPLNDHVGDYSIDIIATDAGALQAVENITLSISNINDAPDLNGVLPAQTSNEDVVTQFTVDSSIFSDVDFGDILTFTVALEGQALPTWISYDDLTNLVTVQPTQSEVGSYTLSLIATDLSGESTSADFSLTVESVNSLPVLANPNSDFSSEEYLNQDWYLNANTFTDVDSPLQISATLANGSPLPSWLGFNVVNESSQYFTLQTDYTSAGVYDIKVTAIDDFGETVNDMVTLTITELNQLSISLTDSDDVMSARVGDDTITALRGNDTIFGLTGNDILYGNEGSDNLYGGAGSDTLYGGAGNDDLEGGVGNDSLIGGLGNDTYVLSHGDGFDVITDDGGTADIIEFSPNVEIGDVFLSKNGNDLLIQLPDSSAQLSVTNHYEKKSKGEYAIEGIQFSGGAYWDQNTIDSLIDQMSADLTLTGTSSADILQGYSHSDTLTGLSGNDTLYGGGGNDSLTGGPGDDLLIGGSGDDVYHYSLGDGSDVIDNQHYLSSGVDAIQFSPLIAEADVVVSRSADDLLLVIAGQGTITAQGYFDGGTSSAYAVDEIRFGSGTVWQTSDVLSMAVPNNLPVGIADSVATAEDITLQISAGILLANDSDADGDLLSISSVQNSNNGTVSFDVGTDTVTFTPTTDYNGQGTFEYVVSDGRGSSTVQVTVDISAVNDAPIAVPDSYTTQVDTPVAVTGASLLSNDYDVEGSALTITDVNNAVNGSVIWDSATDSILFTPQAGFEGAASFSYSVSDGTLTTTESVSVDVSAPNSSPVALDDTVSAIESTPLAINVATLLSNDSDPDGDSLSITTVFGAVNGVVSLDIPSGTVTFTPDSYFTGTSSFDYVTSDGVATVQATVMVTTAADSSLAGYLPGTAGADILAGGNGQQHIHGLGGDDTLVGGRGNDYLYGGDGNDVLSGDRGNDTYVFSLGGGNDTIDNTNAANNDNDTLLFAGDMTPDELWFTQDSNDLWIDMIGVNDRVIVQDWYNGGSDQLDWIYADGRALNGNQVDQLVSAMDAFTRPDGEGAVIPQIVLDQLSPVIDSVWL